MHGFKGYIINFVVKNVKKMVPKYNIKGSISFCDALFKGGDLSLHPHEGKTEDTIAL